MSDSVTLERQSNTEIQGQTAFDKMQAFLKEHGEINLKTQKLRFERPVGFLTKLSLLPLGLDREYLRHYFDLSISQNLPAGDIELMFIDTTKEGIPKRTNTQILLTNSLSNREEKAIIRPFNRIIGNAFSISQDRWKEVKDEAGSYYATDAEEEVEKIVKAMTERWQKPETLQGVKRQRIGAVTEVPKISRRAVLKLAILSVKALALDTLLSHIPYTPSLSKAFWEQLEIATLGVPPEQLRKEIETRFNIEIVSPSTGVREIKYSGESTISTVEWDSPRLKMLTRTLAELPSHFYSPRKVGEEERKLQVALTNQPLINLRGANILKALERIHFCRCSGDEEQPLVVLDKKTSGPIFLESIITRQVIVHEFAHVVTTPEIDKYIDKIAVPVGLENLPQLRKTFSSTFIITSKGEVKELGLTEGYSKDWTIFFDGDDLKNAPKTIVVDESKLTLGDPYAWPYTEEREGSRYLDYKNLAEDKVVSKSRLIRINPEWNVVEEELNRYGEEFFRGKYQEYLAKVADVRDAEKYGGDILAAQIPFIDRTYLGYGAVDFHEFFSVAAAFYIRGHDKFVGTYKPFLGLERAQKLYEGMKDEIFRGREYN